MILLAALKKAISSLGEDIGDNDLREMVEEAKAGVDDDDTQVKYAILIKAMYADEPEDEQ